MTFSFRSQVWVVIAVATIVGQPMVMLLGDPEWVSLAAVGVAALVGALLLRGSRVAWSIATISAGGQVVEAAFASRPAWMGILNASVLFCLFVPSTMRYVWHRDGLRGNYRGFAKIKQNARDLLYRLLVTAAGWEASVTNRDQKGPSRSYKTLIWRLGLSTLLLLLLVGLTYNWQQETGDDVVPNVVADIAWSAYAVIQFAFLVVVSLAAIRHFSSGRSDTARN